MREKQLQWVVTFPTTTAALTMEELAREQNVPGRLIPTPRVVTASCGLAWKAPLEGEQAVKELLRKNNLQHTEVLQLWL